MEEKGRAEEEDAKIFKASLYSRQQITQSLNVVIGYEAAFEMMSNTQCDYDKSQNKSNNRTQYKFHKYFINLL